MIARLKRLGFGSFLILLLLYVLISIPLVNVLLMSLTPSSRLFTELIPSSLTLANYRLVISEFSNFRYYLNSWVISLSVASITVAVASLGAYGLSRFTFRLKRVFILYILVTQMLPQTLLIISYFLVVKEVGLYNTYLSIILVETTRTIPFVTLMLTSIFDGIPKDIDRSAMIDGCSRVKIFTRMILPVAKSGLFAGFVFAFLDSYGELLYALTLTKDITTMPVTVQMTFLLGRYVVSWEKMIPLAVLFSIPIFIIFAATQNSFIRGLTAGSLSDL